jgi:hypothetical protein
VTESKLVGRGVELVREYALAARVQAGLERLYQLTRVASVEDYITVEAGARETLFVRSTDDGAIELSLRVPALEDAARNANALDRICQIIEGVSHFVYVADRAARDQSTTQLELELQAEVDKYVVLGSSNPNFDAVQSSALRISLFQEVEYINAAATEEGERYRTASVNADRFTRKLEQHYIRDRNLPALRKHLRAFYQMGLEDKLRAARE